LDYRDDVSQLLAAVELVGERYFLRAEELHGLCEDARHVRVALEAVALDQSEDALHLALVVYVLGGAVLVERVARRAVDEEVAVLAVAAGPLCEELPALLAAG